MQLTCTNCAARYLVDPAEIGTTGRTVQCFRCGHKWRATVVLEATATDVGVPPAPDAVVVPDMVIRPPDPSEISNLPVLAARRRTPAWMKMAAAIIVTVGVLGGAGYLVADRFIATLGIDEKTARITYAPGPDGKTVMVIAGDIINVGRSEAIAKRLRVVFKDAQGKPFAERALAIDTGRIPSRGRAPFEARIDDAPATSAMVGIQAD